MKCELLIMRHGKSDWSVPVDDLNRPLTRRGRGAVRLMADWLREQELTPELVIASPAARAVETCEKVRTRLHLNPGQVVWDPRLYEASPADLVTVLRGIDSDIGRALVIGHNPGLELLLEYLVERLVKPGDGKLLPTAAIARLGLGRSWRDIDRYCGVLRTLMRPRDLAEKHSGKATS
jgi:phosphohistidine phosphatase